jgi:1-deoxy-D-xylulose-5-phosphate synthase
MDIVLSLARTVKHLAVVEENAVIGGVGSAVSDLLSSEPVHVLKIGLPDRFIEHGNSKVLRDKYGLTSEKIAHHIKEWMGS